MVTRCIVDNAQRLGSVHFHNKKRCILGGRKSAGRISILSGQISQHYIYNSLQSIRGLCDTDPAKARDAIDAFSEYLRGNLESLTIETLIPFARELEITQAYLELEQLVGSRLFEVAYQLETTDFMLPPLVLQPVVENAVKHGTVRTASDAEPGSETVTLITIATRERDGFISIEVTDRTETGKDAAAGVAHAETDEKPFFGAPETAKNRKKRKSVGLDNIRARLDMQCDGKLYTESTYSGTKVTIILPVSPQAKK